MSSSGQGLASSLESPSTSSPRGQFHFPRQESSQRPTISTSNLRQDSTSGIAGSIGGPLDNTTNRKITPIQELSKNAISTLLQPPIIQTGLVPHISIPTSSAHRQPSARDIPPVSLANIRHVDPSVFQSYLSQVGSLFDAYQRAKQENEDAPSPLSRRRTDLLESPATTLRRESRSGSASSTISSRRQSSTVFSPVDSQQERKPSSVSASRRRQYAPTPLSTIPNVYFEENFQLENPRIFDIVSERAEVVPQPRSSSVDERSNANGPVHGPGSGRKALHTNAILQEKLSWYMDTVEVHLISSIATASSSFFAALGSLKELHSEAADSIAKIKTLRSALRVLDTHLAEGGVKLVNMRRRRANFRKLGEAVDQLLEVTEEFTKCEELVDEADLESANNQIGYLENLIAGSAAPPDGNPGRERFDLRQLKALDGMPEAIGLLRTRIGKGFEARFIDALLLDLRQHVRNVPKQDTLYRWTQAFLRTRGEYGRSQSVIPAYLQSNEALRRELLAALGGLNKSGHTGRAATAYREAILREIRSMIREYLPSSSDDDAESMTSISTRGGHRLTQQEKSSILARNLRALDPEAAEELLIKMYTSVGEALRRLGMQVKVVLDVTSSIDGPMSPMRSPITITTAGYIQEEVTQALDLSSLLGQAVDTIETQVNKVLKVRSEQSAQLPLQNFLRYFRLNRLFADECEAVSGRSGDSIKGVISSHVSEFLRNMAEFETQTIVKSLDSERWEAKDFGAANSEVLSRVLEGMTTTAPAWTIFSQLWDEPPVNGVATANGSADSSIQDRARSAIIEDQKFILVESGAAALRGVERYENLIAGIPSLASDASMRILEYLKLFNSRCVQLILGSGARQSAGLKSITTKHLALASQTISFVVAFIPYVREFVRRQSSSASNILPEFDKVKRLFQDHQVGIHDKLVEIMSGRSAVHVNAMKMIKWDDSDPGDGVSRYMETLTKETTTLHKVLSRHVNEMDIKTIMTPIFAHYSQDWSRAFREAQVTTQAGKARLLRDVDYYDSKMSKIDGAGELGKNLVEIVSEKQVETMHVPAPVQETTEEREPEVSTEPANEVATESANESATEPVNEVATESANESATETAASIARDQEKEPATEPTTEPTTEPATEPVTEPVTERVRAAPSEREARSTPGNVSALEPSTTNDKQSHAAEASDDQNDAASVSNSDDMEPPPTTAADQQTEPANSTDETAEPPVSADKHIAAATYQAEESAAEASDDANNLLFDAEIPDD